MSEGVDEIHVLGSESAGRMIEASTIIVLGALCAVVAGSGVFLVIGSIGGFARLLYLVVRAPINSYSAPVSNVELVPSRTSCGR
ncbi:hypothetical protein G8767_02165 [Rhodococcus sp. IC4_135]|uniref:hypothetical protein n=1 Tax=Rhodococcus TaxID=1827 RepID=UPI00141F6A75|nr:hypothetical protein [Rhodococcus erythropolis]NHP12348.1 hypothetical protein [Rhodococcus sp. IC4_135]